MANERPTVRVIGTGGSIAGVGPDRMDFILYPEIGDHITIQQSLDRVPEIQDIADVLSEDLVSVGSTAIGAAEGLGLARRRPPASGYNHRDILPEFLKRPDETGTLARNPVICPGDYTRWPVAAARAVPTGNLGFRQ